MITLVALVGLVRNERAASGKAVYPDIRCRDSGYRGGGKTTRAEAKSFRPQTFVTNQVKPT
jgi:hypothetical protein